MLLKGKRIFIVEDNPQNRVVFQMALIMPGARVDFERWGKDSLQMLKGIGSVDLIILDLMLYNGVSGYDIFDQIRAVERFQSIPVIAVSASDPSTALPETQRRGFSGFIAKPIDMELFSEQVAKVLAGEKIWYVGGIYTGPASK